MASCGDLDLWERNDIVLVGPAHVSLFIKGIFTSVG